MVNRTKASADLDAIFAALAHPIRRAIVERLAGGDATVGELAEPHKVSLPAISKHLRLLEDAGLLQVEPEGRVHRCQLDVAPCSTPVGRLTRYRVLRDARFGRLAAHLGATRKPRRQERQTHARK